jgi:hypothetical protein
MDSSDYPTSQFAPGNEISLVVNHARCLKGVAVVVHYLVLATIPSLARQLSIDMVQLARSVKTTVESSVPTKHLSALPTV